MKIKYQDNRVVMDNLTTYSVSRKEKDGKVRYAIFFNFVGGGYKELVAFKTLEKARTIADIIDNSGMDIINDQYTTVVDRATKKVVMGLHKHNLFIPIVDDDGDSTGMYKMQKHEDGYDNVKEGDVFNPDYHYFYCENVLDIGEIIKAFGWEKSVVTVNEKGGE